MAPASLKCGRLIGIPRHHRSFCCSLWECIGNENPWHCRANCSGISHKDRRVLERPGVGLALWAPRGSNRHVVGYVMVGYVVVGYDVVGYIVVDYAVVGYVVVRYAVEGYVVVGYVVL